MSGDENFDPYESWLGLPPGASHDHYALLGLPRFESDPAVIEQRADERLRLVRSFQMGPRGRYTQKLLNELTAAKLCLLSPAARQSYDELLRVLPQGAWGETEQEEVPAELPPGAEPVPQAMPVPPPVAPLGEPAEAEDGEPPDRRLLLAGVGLGVLAVCLGGWVIGSLVTAGKGKTPGERPVATATAAPVESPAPPQQQTPTGEAAAGDDSSLIEIQQEGSGDFSLSPATAALSGNLVLELDGVDDVVQGWGTSDDVACWRFRVVQPGFFQVQITYAAIDEVFGRRMNLTVDGQTKSLEVQPTSAEYRTDLLTIAVPKTGPHELKLSPATRLDGEMKVKLIRLTPVGAGN